MDDDHYFNSGTKSLRILIFMNQQIRIFLAADLFSKYKIDEIQENRDGDGIVKHVDPTKEDSEAGSSVVILMPKSVIVLREKRRIEREY